MLNSENHLIMPFEHSIITKTRDRFKIIALICLVLAIYLPGLNAGFFIFDDFDMVVWLDGIDASESVNFFGFSEGDYWRPLVILSFLFDVSLFNANSSWMHLHNILLHATNTTLVFYIVRALLAQQKRGHEWPLISAALFAIHPVSTEAVNWISGRTDLLASVFALAGVYLFLLSIRSQNRLLSWLSALSVLLGCMAKEVAFPIFPAAFLSLYIVKDWKLSTDSSTIRVKPLSYGLPFLLGGCAYLLLRAQSFANIDRVVGKVIEGTTVKGPILTEQVHTALVSLGFYLKKLFIPAPLNFAIDNVSPLYLWLSLLMIVVCSCLIFKRTINSALVLFVLLTIAPAILVAIFKIAWTPYAERYLYLPSAFLCIGLIVCNYSDKNLVRSRNLLITFFFICCLGLTIHRNLQWAEPVEILADALRQNPDNISLRINYAIVLANNLEQETARRELKQILKLEPTKQVIHRNLALISLKLENAADQARKDLDVFFDGTQEPEAETLSIMIEVNEKRLIQSPAEALPTINQELFIAYWKYHLLTGDPVHLFAAVEKASTTDEQESVRELLVKLEENPALPESVLSMAKEFLATISLLQNSD